MPHRAGVPVWCGPFRARKTEPELVRAAALIPAIGGMTMLVERGLQVMNADEIGNAYAIAANYLRKAGSIPDTLEANEPLLTIIVQLFQQGEYNRLKLANKAIAKFESSELA